MTSGLAGPLRRSVGVGGRWGAVGVEFGWDEESLLGYVNPFTTTLRTISSNGADVKGEFQSIIPEHFLRVEARARAADHLLQAGDEAARLSADAEARGHYEKAMNAPRRAARHR
jgi:hypothetical protein